MARKETIEVRPIGELDRFNDPVGPPATWQEIPGATVVPRNSQDYEQRGPVVVEGFLVVVPSPVRDVAGQAVPLRDNWEVRARGEVYQIEGAIADYGRKIMFYLMRAS